MRFVLREAGLVIPDYYGQDGIQRPIRHANEFWDNYGITVHDENRQAGDLVLFSRTGSFPTHIGIMYDEDTYIHAPGISESRVTMQPIAYALIAARGMERQLYSRNPIGFKSPTIRIEEPTYRSHQRPI